MKEDQRKKNSVEHKMTEEEADYLYDVIPTHYGYMTRKEYNDLVWGREEHYMTEEDYKRREEMENDPQFALDKPTFREVVHGRVSRMLRNFKSDFPKKNRDMDKER